MSWKRKRSAPLVEKNSEGNSPNNIPLSEILITKLNGQDRNERMQAFGLLASIEGPLKAILKNGTILEALLMAIEDDDKAIAAEAASVLRKWTLKDTDNVRLLYAHCIFPKLLGLLWKGIKVIESIGQTAKNEVLLVEHWLVSLVLSVWAFVEEMPPALTQLNNSAIISLASLVLESKTFFQNDTMIVLLQLLLCASEDNRDLFGPSVVDAARLEKILKNLQLDPPTLHIRLLSMGLLRIINGSLPTFENVKYLFNILIEVPQDEWEMQRDLLEMLANMISDVDLDANNDDFVSILINFCIFKALNNNDFVGVTTTTFNDKIKGGKVKGDDGIIVRECIQRAISCLINLILSNTMSVSGLVKQDLWIFCLGKLLPLVRSDTIILSTLSELLRILVLASISEGYRLEYSAANDLMIREVCMSWVEEDRIICNLVSIPAILYQPSFSDIDWLLTMVKTLFLPGRPLKTILGVAETLEELAKQPGAIPFDLMNHLKGNKTLIVKSCKTELDSMDFQMRQDRQEEVDYIISTLNAIIV